MLSTTKPIRRRHKRLSKLESIRFVRNVKELMNVNAYDSTCKLSQILGCSRRTARRIMNSGEDDLTPMRRSYLHNAAKALGVPTSRLISREVETSDVSDRINKLISKLPIIEHFDNTVKLGQVMTSRCMFGYGLPTDFFLEVGDDLEPTAIRLLIRERNKPNCTHKVDVEKDLENIWTIKYTHHELGLYFRGLLNEKNFELVLKRIKDFENASTKKQSPRTKKSGRVRSGSFNHHEGSENTWG